MGAARVHEIQGREVRLPAVVREARAGSATYLVSAAAARRLLPDPALDVAELLPGRALASLAVIDYIDNDLGDYNEVSISLFVRERSAPRGLPFLGTALDMARGRLGTYIDWLPVNQSFTRQAGCGIWGFPKTEEEIRFDYAAKRATCTLVAEGKPVLTLSVPRGGARTLPDQKLVTYTMLEGSLHRVCFVSGADGFGVGLGGAELSLGSHPYADRLRSLGLPRRALMTSWMERMHGRFEAPEKL